MDSKGIPAELHQRVVNYYQFQHKKNRELEAARLINLPKSLMIKVANANYRDLIDRCANPGRPFYGCKEQLVNAILVKLSMVHVMPGDDIVHKDDISRELYFLRDGAVQVVDDHERVLSVIRSDVPDMPPLFGEVPFFLGINHLHSIKACMDGDVQLMVLSKKDSTDLFAEYPDEHSKICENLMSTFDLTWDGKQIAGVDEDASDLDKMVTRMAIIESMNQRTELRSVRLN